MLTVDGEGTPLSAFITDAATSEVQSIESLVTGPGRVRRR